MEANISPVDLSEQFRFACTPEVPCFNTCCRDLNQFLTPYDILMLKNYLKLSSGAFLQEYSACHVGPTSGLPVITLKARDAETLACPFVTPEGCRVYPARPSSCRIYPLARAVTFNRDTGQSVEHFALLREPHCRGHRQNYTQAVSLWIEEQDIAAGNRINDLMLKLISLKNRLHPGPLDLKSRRLFELALYDTDAFRTKVFEEDLLTDYATAPKTLEAARQNDLALLRLGHDWIEFALFRSSE